MSLRDIPVHVESPMPASLLGSVRPILHEIETLLATLVETGQGGSIDLRGLPMSPTDDAALAAALGAGEVNASVRALGETQVQETAIHGVWRTTHRDDSGHVVADLIEVSHVPEILKTHDADARAALSALRARLKTE